MASKQGGQDAVLVAAIDIGTSYSGYAYQFYSDYKENTVKIISHRAWNSGKRDLISLKTPTCLLLSNNQELEECAFGFEAENRCANLCFEKENEKYYFFQRFKMLLQEGEGLKKATTIKDVTGKKMLALDVFALSIKCLKKHLMEELQIRGTGLKEEDIFWILTVPAIWDNAAKQFMREAAIKSGIQSEKLEIALEPEAASLFCQYIPLTSPEDQVKFVAAPLGTKYMVVDLGGGTADITVHEKLRGGKLKEIMKASGGPWGGTAVDSAFFQLLVSIVGGPVMNRFIKEETYDYIDLSREFEAAKRNFSKSTKNKMIMKLPASLNKLYEDMVGRSFETCLAESVLSTEVSLKTDKIMINSSKVEELFRKATDHIVHHMKGIMEKGNGKEVSMILMVGGFSESKYVQEVICETFQRKNGIQVIIPQDAGITVVKGAVLFGRMPQSIASRVVRFTYGERVNRPFLEGTHPEEKKVISFDSIKCKDVFDCIISADSEVTNDFSITKAYCTSTDFQEAIPLEVYYTTEKQPQFTTDPGCKLLGETMAHISNPCKGERWVDVTYQFGLTELKIRAVERETNRVCLASFKMIE